MCSVWFFGRNWLCEFQRKKERKGGDLGFISRKEEEEGDLGVAAAWVGGDRGRKNDRESGRSRRMPYVLTLKAPLERSKPVWEGEGCDDSSHSHSPQRRCHSVSTPRELKNSSSSIQVRAASLGDEQQQELSTTQSGLAPSASSSSPVLRRRRGYGSRGCTVASEGGKPDASVGNGGLGMGAGAGDRRSAVEQSRSAAGNNNNNHHQAAAAAAGGGGGGRREGVRRVESYESSGNLSSGQQQPQQPQQQQQRVAQRLLVVANRLPVSAIRDGDGWDLKLSAGGLVSALLGMKSLLSQ